MENTQDTPAASTNRSLVSQDGKFPQLSEQAAALLSSMRIENESLKNSETILILLLLLEGITANTTSGDVLALGIYHAKDRCEQLRINEETFKKVINHFKKFSEIRKQTCPFAY